MSVPSAQLAHLGRPPRILLLAMLPIGDTICILPTVRALRRRYPEALICAMAYGGSVPLLRCAPEIDDVLLLPPGWDPRTLWHLAMMIRHLHARAFDAVVDFTSPAFKWISLLSAIPIRTYMHFEHLWWLIPSDHVHWRSTHLTAHYYSCARELGLPTWESVDHSPVLTLPASARTAAQAYLRSALPRRHSGPLVAIHAGGAWLGGLKRWPAERFALLAQALEKQWQAQIVFLGGPEDLARSASIAGRLSPAPLLAVGTLPLLASLALLESCDLFIGNDSMLLHAAAALGTPYTGIFGPTSVANFQPRPRDPRQGVVVTPVIPCGTPHYAVGGDVLWRRPCCRGTCAALTTIAVSMVYEAAAGLLEPLDRLQRTPL